MTRWSRPGAGAGALAMTLCLVAAACSTDDEPDDAGASGASGASSAASPTPTPTVPASPSTSPSGSASSDWTVTPVLEASPKFDGTLQATDDLVVAPRGSRSGVFRRAPGGGAGELLLEIVPQPGFDLVETLLDRAWVVWVEVEQGTVESPDDEPATRVFAWDSRTRTTVALGDQPDVLDPGLPMTYDLVGSALVHTTQDGQATNCLAVTDLATMRSRLLRCTERKEQGIGDPVLSAEGLVYNRFDPEPRPRGCVTVWSAETDGADPRPVPGRKKCQGSTGVRGPGFVLWGERARADCPDLSRLYAETSDGVAELGPADTGSEVVCGDWAYWTAIEADQTVVKRWRPGLEPEVVKTDEPGWVLFAAMRCEGERLTGVRFPDGAGPVQLVELAPPA